MTKFFEPPIQRMKVKAFRGFRDPREFDLSASAVIVTGPNGTGKTSFFDALQWCLLGTIQRLEEFRAKNNVEHVVNQWRLKEKAVVELDLLLAGENIFIRRVGDHAGSTLEFVRADDKALFGQEAERALRDALIVDGQLTLEMALSTSGLMQQDVMRSVLQAKPSDRYRHLTNVLGLARLEEFEASARELVKSAKERKGAACHAVESARQSLNVSEARLTEATERFEALPQADSVRKEILASRFGRPEIAVVELSAFDVSDAEACNTTSASINLVIDRIEAFVQLRDLSLKVAVPLEEEQAASVLESQETENSLVESELHKYRELHSSAEKSYIAASAVADDIAKLASSAIPLLSDSCPVCHQSIDRHQVERDLRARAESASSMIGLRAEKDRTRQRADLLEARLRENREFRQRLVAIDAEWTQYRATQARVKKAFAALRGVEGRVRITAQSVESFAPHVEVLLGELGSLRRKLRELLSAMQSGGYEVAIEREKSEVVSLRKILRERDSRLKAESERALTFKELSDAAIRARVAVTERRFAAVQPLVADIFSRLDPHPAFKTFGIEMETYRGRGTTTPVVHDPEEGIAADPLVIFSTSQANIAALSYFLAMGVSIGNKGLPFVLLDDPVQSMDDVNVLGFADLCRHLRQSRQMIISTHDHRFAKLLQRKLAPRREFQTATLIEFLGWDRSGPAVQQSSIDAQFVDEPFQLVGRAS